ncbi:MAG: nitroreductase family protein [Deltaproteobacteria bacterium]|nr:nitroreductase family protein [Deltaproteobacteria bacterium]
MNAGTTVPFIDIERCTGCGRCVSCCPVETLSLIDGKAVVTGICSLGCGHCSAACPEDAIFVPDLEVKNLLFETLQVDRSWIPPGKAEAGELVRLMASRRSCRSFLPRPVGLSTLRDLVRAGITAPSGTNSQRWVFTVLASRKAVERLGDGIAAFFKRLNRLAGRTVVRRVLKLLGKKELDRYYREHYESVREALRDWDGRRRDRLFHGAPAVIIIGSHPGGSCPSEDALLAAQNILLAAHAMGLGTCLIGFAVKAMKRDRRIARQIGILDCEGIYAVIALGYTEERYERTAGRRSPAVRFVEA